MQEPFSNFVNNALVSPSAYLRQTCERTVFNTIFYR